jgi:hypothetical protein
LKKLIRVKKIFLRRHFKNNWYKVSLNIIPILIRTLAWTTALIKMMTSRTSFLTCQHREPRNK